MLRCASLAVLLAATTLAGCATGGGPDGPGGRQEPAAESVVPEALIFLEFDTNHDRIITDAELKTGIESDWAQASKGSPSNGTHLRGVELRPSRFAKRAKNQACAGTKS